jgi:hypothetical protein
MITIFGQRDPRWSTKRMGISNATLGKYGCTTCAICTLASWFNDPITPAIMADDRKLYTSQGLIIWKNIKLDKLRFEKRIYGFNSVEINKSLKDPNTCVILEVDGKHWVSALSRSIWGGYNIADPWLGDRCNSRRYHRITGSAHFKK